jgi:small-conductance mechanosensitive channel
MARTQLREGARRDRSVGGERSFATPVRVAAPMIATAVAIAFAALVSFVAGLTPTEVLVVAGAVFGAATVFAHRTVASMLAGITLLVVRPYAAGERVRIQSPIDGCLIDVVIVHIGLANTTLASDAGVLVVPNHRLLRNPPAAAPPAERCPEPCG